MRGVTERTKQLDAEIVGVVRNAEKITGYGIQKRVQAPVSTIHYRLRRLVETGELDCREDRHAKVYSLPKETRI